jgi:isocitrate dehydrogenase
LLPIIRSFANVAGITVGVKDISLAGRIISSFPERLSDTQRQPDDLAELGELVKKPTANVIKLPNISASLPQLLTAVKELQAQGYDLPNYPEVPSSEVEKDVRFRYDAIKGSAVNPVLREGNSDRRAAVAVKNYAMANPHSMGVWSDQSKGKPSTGPGTPRARVALPEPLSAAISGPGPMDPLQLGSASRAAGCLPRLLGLESVTVFGQGPDREW